MEKNKLEKTMVDSYQISFLKRHLGAKKEDIINAVAAVGNNLERIQVYLLRKKMVNNFTYQDRTDSNYAQ